MNINLSSSGTISINGEVYNGRNVVINNGNVTIDGKSVGTPNPPISVEVFANVERLESAAGDVTVNGDVGSVKTQAGDVKCNNVAGSVQTMSGDVTCRGVIGSAKTMSGNIRGL
ncbi:MAG: hypothetical protein ACRDDI_13505 [Aeromonas veronii]